MKEPESMTAHEIACVLPRFAARCFALGLLRTGQAMNNHPIQEIGWEIAEVVSGARRPDKVQRYVDARRAGKP